MLKNGSVVKDKYKFKYIILKHIYRCRSSENYLILKKRTKKICTLKEISKSVPDFEAVKAHILEKLELSQMFEPPCRPRVSVQETNKALLIFTDYTDHIDIDFIKQLFTTTEAVFKAMNYLYENKEIEIDDTKIEYIRNCAAYLSIIGTIMMTTPGNQIVTTHYVERAIRRNSEIEDYVDDFSRTLHTLTSEFKKIESIYGIFIHQVDLQLLSKYIKIYDIDNPNVIDQYKCKNLHSIKTNWFLQRANFVKRDIIDILDTLTGSGIKDDATADMVSVAALVQQAYNEIDKIQKNYNYTDDIDLNQINLDVITIVCFAKATYYLKVAKKISKANQKITKKIKNCMIHISKYRSYMTSHLMWNAK